MLRFLFLFAVLISVGNATAQQPQTLEVTLRNLGHQILLHAGDSTSRVLPVLHHKNQHTIKFASSWNLIPDSVYTITQRVLNEAQLTTPVNISVKQCQTQEVVYAFNYRALDTSLAPCLGRKYPKDCYTIVMTMLEDKPAYFTSANTEGEPVLSSPKKTQGPALGWIVGIGLALVGSGILWLYRQKEVAESQPQTQIAIGSYIFNPAAMSLAYGDSITELTGKESALLTVLHRGANGTLTKEQLLQEVWGDEGAYVGRTLDVYISKLRKKLEQDDRVKIINIRGVGYKMVLPS